MFKSYQEIFKIPGTKTFTIAALVGRMPMAMAAIGIITMLSQLRGAYAVAGTVAAAFSFAMALLGPQVSRLVDRYGQGKVLPIAAIVSASAMLALVLLARAEVPIWTLLALAAIAGCMPSMSAMVRARWTPLCRDTPQLRTAYALESVLDEVSFIIGPPLSIGLSVAWFPEAGLLAALLLQLIGVAAFVLQRSTEPPVQAGLGQREGSPIRMFSIQMLVFLLLAMGTIVGTIDVVSVAFAAQQGHPASASIVLSVYALGACLAGLIFGALNLKFPLPKLLLYCGLATALTTVPLLFVGSIASLAAAMFIGGLFFAPTMIVAMALVEQIVASSKLTEGFTWMISGLGVGMALGAAVAGEMVDVCGVRAGFNVALAAGAVAVCVVGGVRYILPGSRL